MPYVKEKDRTGPIDTTGKLTYHVCEAVLEAQATGDIYELSILNSILDGILVQYLDERYGVTEVTSYAQINDWVGSCYCALHELHRRDFISFMSQTRLLEYIRDFYRDVVVPYEDQKIKENGDIV